MRDHRIAFKNFYNRLVRSERVLLQSTLTIEINKPVGNENKGNACQYIQEKERLNNFLLNEIENFYSPSSVVAISNLPVELNCRLSTAT